MATVVLDLDLTNLPCEITGLAKYSKAFILIRYKGKPIGKITVPVYDGYLNLEQVYHDIINAVEYKLKIAWLHDHLKTHEAVNNYNVSLKATIAICTRDRPEDLRRCLDALMKLPDDGQEILVIDNCSSSDETKKIVKSYCNVRYIYENRPGLDIARNRALLEAKYDIVAFTDDDATPDPMWLRALLRNFDHPLVMCVTGMTMPLELETEAQEAFERYSPFGKGFNRRVFSHTTNNPLISGQVGAGANMALRKEVQQTVGFFDEALDAGTPTESGGDHEFFSRILISGYTIIYEPEALSWHRHRRTWKETHKAIKGYGIGVYAFWTRLLFVEGETGVLKFPYNWFIRTQLPNVIKSVLRKPNSLPLSLLLAELQGCVLGPWKYFLSRKKRQHFCNETYRTNYKYHNTNT
jgi:glycosyltransferase involved in cell wall biosynthesis